MNATVLAIDPGPVRSGVVLWGPSGVAWAQPDMLNGAVLAHIEHGDHAPGQVLAIETMQANYAATVGASVIETLIWIGEFRHAWRARHESEPILISRQQVKAAVCAGNTRANDAGVRQALIDRLGPPGTKKAPGPTYKVSSHAWAALAVAVAAANELAAAT